MSDRVKHSKRSQRSFNVNNGVKKLFVAMAFKRAEEKAVRERAKAIKEMLSKKDMHIGEVDNVGTEI